MWQKWPHRTFITDRLSVVKGGVTECKNLIRESTAIGTVPFTTKNVLSLVNKKWQSLPAGQKRNLNEGYSNVKGDTKDETLISWGLMPVMA